MISEFYNNSGNYTEMNSKLAIVFTEFRFKY